MKLDVQKLLDDEFFDQKICSYETKKSDVDNKNPDEYIIYMKSSENDEIFADDEPLVTVHSLSIIYYFSARLKESSVGRTRIKDISKRIKSLFIEAGAMVTGGPFDSGDIDNIGFGTKTVEVDVWEMNE